MPYRSVLLNCSSSLLLLLPSTASTVPPVPARPCDPNPCGVNAECIPVGHRGDCRCLPDYYGDPYVRCQPQCTTNRDCAPNLACVNLKCVDPCPGSCGIKASCKVVNHAANCYCDPGYTGDPYRGCRVTPSKCVVLCV